MYIFILISFAVIFFTFCFSYFFLRKRQFLSQREFMLLKVVIQTLTLLKVQWIKSNRSYTIYKKCSFCQGSGILVKQYQNQTSLQTTFEIETVGCHDCGGKAFFYKKICISKSTFLESTNNNEYFKRGKGYIHSHYIWSAQERMFFLV